jgi:hypothetical protein
MENPQIKNAKITVFDFYSVWIAIYLIVYILINALVKLPKWLSPYYAVIGACLGQFVMFVVGWNVQPRWYIIVSITCKISMLLLAIFFTSKQINLETILWLSICFLFYLLYIKLQKNKNFKNMYYDAIKNPETYQNLLQNIKHLFPFLF